MGLEEDCRFWGTLNCCSRVGYTYVFRWKDHPNALGCIGLVRSSGWSHLFRRTTDQQYKSAFFVELLCVFKGAENEEWLKAKFEDLRWKDGPSREVYHVDRFRLGAAISRAKAKKRCMSCELSTPRSVGVDSGGTQAKAQEVSDRIKRYEKAILKGGRISPMLVKWRSAVLQHRASLFGVEPSVVFLANKQQLGAFYTAHSIINYYEATGVVPPQSVKEGKALNAHRTLYKGWKDGKAGKFMAMAVYEARDSVWLLDTRKDWRKAALIEIEKFFKETGRLPVSTAKDKKEARVGILLQRIRLAARRKQIDLPDWLPINHYEAEFEQRLKRLAEFVMAHNRPPNRSVPVLGDWFHGLREGNVRLTSERQKRLREAGVYDWVVAPKEEFDALNRRQRPTTRRINVGGESRTVSEWANKMGCSVGAIQRRLQLGWTPEDAVTIEVKAKTTL